MPTKKPVNLVKNSFSLLETILSVVILSILIVNFNSFYSDDKSLNKLNENLNTIENLFTKEDYSSFDKSKQNLNIVVDNKNLITIKTNVYTYENENILLFKYVK